MNKHGTITYRLLFCIFLLTFFNTIAYNQSNGTSLRNDITVEHVIEFPKEGFRNEPIRLVKDEVTGNLLYNEYGGTIWEVDITSPTPSFNFRYSAFDHNLPIVQGMTMHDDVLYLVGNEEVNNGDDNVGIIVKGVRIDENRREWTVIARTEPYLGKPETPFDHKMAGNAVSPDGQFIYVSTNSRTNHGEVAGLGREDELNILILKIPTNPNSPIDLRNDKAWLRNNGYLYAEGIRNGFDMAFDKDGNLFEVENSGQRDDPEEMNWIREGRHYGFPYRLGGNDNPIISADYDSNNDPLVPDDQKGTPLFAYDPNFPAPPAEVTFSEPIRNLGPDADLFRDPITGAIRDASNEGSFITTFTAHRSPVGFGFDNANNMGGDFTGDAFMASFSGNTWPLIGGDSEDLLHIELNYNGALDNYDANVYKIATGFAQPIDIVVDENVIWLAEYGDGVNRGLWKITLPCGNPSVCGIVTPPIYACEDINVQGGEGQIMITGLTAPNEIVQVFDANFNLVFRCEGGDCGNEQLIDNLSAEKHLVNIQFYDENFEFVCSLDGIPINVTGGNNGCNGTLNGDLNLFTQAEVDAYAGYEVINGSLRIGNFENGVVVFSDITSLEPLQCLKEVKADLRINRTNLTNLKGLDNLEKIGASLDFFSNQKLQNLEGLEQLQSIQRGLQLNSNPLIQNIDAFQSLTFIGEQIGFSSNEALTSISGLSSVTNPSFNGISIQGNLALTSLNGLENFTTITNGVIGGNIFIRQNNNLTNIEGLQNIIQIDDQLVLENNPRLSNCCAIDHLIDNDFNNGKVDGLLTIRNNASPCDAPPNISADCGSEVLSCLGVEAIGGAGTLQITKLTAPIEIVQVFDTDFNLVFRCQGGDCGNELLLKDLAAGQYFISLQFYTANWELICENDQLSANVSDGSTPSGNCEDLMIEGKEKQIAITNLTAPIEIVQVFDENYVPIFRCEGSNCGSEQFINDLSAGDYFVSIQFYTANWAFICEQTNVKVTVTGDVNPPPPSGSADCAALTFITEAGQISVAGLNTAYSQVQIIGRNTDWQVLTICAGDCAETQIIPNLAAGEYAVKVQLNGADGTDCYREENITVSDGSNNSDCAMEIVAANFPNIVKPGTTITIQATVRNNSTSLSANTTLGLYQFIGGNEFFPAPQLINNTPINGFQPNETRVITFSVQLPALLFNTALLPIGSSSVTNNFILLIGENTGIIEAQKCNFPIDFDIDYPDADLALSFENNQHCIDNEGVVNVDLKVTNAGNTFVKAPIYILLDDNCSFVNRTNVICQPFTNVAYYKLDQDLPVGAAFTIPKPFKVPNTQITEWNYSPSIAPTASNIEDINDSNNSVSATFAQTASCGEDSTVDCNQIQTSSSENQLSIANLTAPIEIVQVFDQNYQLVFRCQGTDCGSEQTINDLAAGNYFVNVQFYTADWKFICAKENIVVEVGGGGRNCEESTKTGFTFLDKMDNKSFYLSDNQLPFNDAKQACLNAGSQLATSLTTATIDFLKNNIEGEAFLDLTDINNEGNFQWADGSTYNATVFDNNTINDYAFVANWATDLVATNEGVWKNFVCEVPCLTFGESRTASKIIEQSIKLFPNPAQSIINLQVLPLMNKKGRIQIFNIYGQLVQQFDQLYFNAAHQQLEIPNFENGIYLLTIQADNMPLISKRFVVEHWK